MSTTCHTCGASYEQPDDGCAERFDALLALDHSRREPWGSRHGLAFSAFVLQHHDRYDRSVLERAWTFLYAVYVRENDCAAVARGLRRSGAETPDWAVPPLPSRVPKPPFGTKITDLGTFAPDTYGQQLDSWCRAALAGWTPLAAS